MDFERWFYKHYILLMLRVQNIMFSYQTPEDFHTLLGVSTVGVTGQCFSRVESLPHFPGLEVALITFTDNYIEMGTIWCPCVHVHKAVIITI